MRCRRGAPGQWLGRRLVVLVLATLATVATVEIDATHAAAATGEVELPAVILRQVIPQTPLETAGSGEAPTVDVRLAVTAEGRVGGVEILRIRPSGDHDADFIAAVEEALAGWRFAPAIANGRPVPASFDWSLEFRPLESASDGSGHPPPDRGQATTALLALLRDDEPEHARLLQIYTLPAEQQRRHLERQIADAESFLAADARKVADNPLFRVVTDHPDEAFPAAVAHNLAVTYGVLADLLGPQIPLQSPGFKMAVYVYRSRTEYLNLVHAIDGIEETSGFFAPPGLIALHADVGSSEELVEIMIHEAVHAFLFRAVIRPGQELPRWLDEGFADYVGRSAITKGQLELGRHRASRYMFSPARVVRGKTVQQLQLEHLQREFRHGNGLTIAQIVGADRETFYGASMGHYYAQSWLLVHLLQHGAPDWQRAAFPRLLLYAAEGYPVDTAMATVYGLELDTLEPRYLEYVRGF